MNQLIPCPGCNRHVRQAENTCPFCSTSLSLTHVPEHALPRTRLGRAATFAFGATLVGATALIACGGESEEKKGGDGGAASGGTTSKAGASTGGSSAGNQPIGGTGVGPVYGAPAPMYGSPAPLYGAPAGGTGNDDGGSSSVGGRVGTGGTGGPGPVYGAPAAGFSGIPLYGAAPAD
jgi:hypothetical protein